MTGRRIPTIDEILGIDPGWTGELSTDEYIDHARSDDSDHIEDPTRPYWCLCGLAGMYETPGVWVCYRSAARRS